MDKINENRDFLKASDWKKWDELERDQANDVPKPPIQKEYPENSELVDLIAPEKINLGAMKIKDVIEKRRSRRRYTDDYLTKEELSYLLWTTQGLKENNSLRNVPSAGARHPFETYLHIKRVKDIKEGLYRYLPKEHKLLFLKDDKGLDEDLYKACSKQRFVKESAITFIWSVIPYRTEWRYSYFAHKVIAIDAGHLCQNLYLASESVDAGTCAIGAYYQEEIDEILDLDGEDEFTIYVATVGKISNN